MNPQAIIASLPIRNRSVLIEQDQDVYDIMKCVIHFHKKHVDQYDRFAYRFNVGDIKEICQELWQFCRDHLTYDIETKKKQTVRSPGRMLQDGSGDCKHYASFIAGVLDSLKRDGKDIDWSYRFAKYVNWKGDVNNHVFVVVTKRNGREIWIDPVLNYFDYHLPYTSAISRGVDTKKKRSVMGCMSDCTCNNMMAGGISIGNAETDLLNSLKGFEMGLQTSVNNLVTKGLVSQGTDAILQAAAASLVPGAGQALQLAGQVKNIVNSVLGAGSGVARYIDAALSGNPLMSPINVINAVFNGRTYNTDQYFGASDYYFYVEGKDMGDSTHVTDAQVIPALKWFIIKTGVFISGRIHINALRQGPDQYLALFKVNNLTTQDRVRVTYASQVVQQYMPANKIAYSWKNTVGVYDNAVTAAIFAARLNNPAAQQDTKAIIPTPIPTTSSTTTISSGIGLMPIILLGAAIFLATTKRHTSKHHI